MIAINHETVGAFCGNDFYYINVKTASLEHITTLPGRVDTATTTPDGSIYFANETSLYKLRSIKFE